MADLVADLLDVLRCRTCGSQFSFKSDQLRCPFGCGDYPLVGDIAVVEDRAATQVDRSLVGETAALALLGEEASERLPAATTYHEALRILKPKSDISYFLHRPSVPSYIVAEMLISTLGQSVPEGSALLDFCGGAGHLSAHLATLTPPSRVVLTDISYDLLWLARRFVSPGVRTVCCDANECLPLAESRFPLIVCADAFFLLWQRRLVAWQLERLLTSTGTIILSHVHNALVEDPVGSAGMPLSSAAYRELFSGLEVRIYRESALLEAALGRTSLDLSANASDDELADEMAFTIVASRDPLIFREYDPLPSGRLATLRVNPLYERVARGDGSSRWKLGRQTDLFEMEFGVYHSYLLDEIEVPDDLGRLSDSELLRLSRSRILIPLPHYALS